MNDDPPPPTSRCSSRDRWRRRVAVELGVLDVDGVVGFDRHGALTWMVDGFGVAALWGRIAPSGTFGLAMDRASSHPAGGTSRHRLLVHPGGLDVCDPGRGVRPAGGRDHVAASAELDIARRVLGRPTSPEWRSAADLTIVCWLELLLDRAADPSTSPGLRSWGDACALHPGSGGRRDVAPAELAEETCGAAAALGWERLRRGVIAGELIVPGASAADAGWMDAPMFGRVLLAAHRSEDELLCDLELFVDDPLLQLIRRTVEATTTKVSPFDRNERGQ